MCSEKVNKIFKELKVSLYGKEMTNNAKNNLREMSDRNLLELINRININDLKDYCIAFVVLVDRINF